MPERLHPGVYVEEVPPAVRAIEGASTSTAAFIGVAERGPVGVATLVTSLADYRRIFGGFLSNSFLSYAVLHFFDNGGKKCYIVRVAAGKPAASSITLVDRELDVQAEPSLTISAANPGKWGNDLDIAVQDSTVDPDNEFKLVVKYKGETVETFDNLSMDSQADNFVETIVNGNSQYVRVKANSSASTAAPGTVVSGALDTTTSVDGGKKFGVKLDGDATNHEVALPGSAAITGADNIAKAVQEAIRSVSTTGNDSYAAAVCQSWTTGDKFRLIIRSGTSGSSSSVVIAAAGNAADDCAATLKLLAADGAQTTSGAAIHLGTSTSDNEPARNLTSSATSFTVNIDGDGPKTLTLPAPLATGVAIANAITAAVKDPSVIPNDPGLKPAYDGFTATYTDVYQLTFGKTSASPLTFTIASTDLTHDDTGGLRVAGKTAAVSPTAGATVKNDHSMSSDAQPTRDIHSLATPTLTLTLSSPDLSIDCPLGDPASLTTGEAIAAAVQTAVRARAANPTSAMNSDLRKADIIASLSTFTCAYNSFYTLTVGAISGGDPRRSSLHVTPASANDASAVLKLGVPNGGREQSGAAMLRPVASAAGDWHVGDHPKGLLVPDTTNGDDGTTPGDQDYLGDAAACTGLHALDTVTDVSLVAIPGQGSKQVVSGGMAYCSNRPLQDCFFIADMGGPSTDVLPNSVTAARNYVNSLSTKNDYGAIYFPWVVAADPIGKGRNPTRLVPPSGMMAGVYARTDSRRGVFKAPAGTEANLADALDLNAKLGDVDQDFLNPIGCDVIRSFPASGIVSWGARTLSPDAAWRYISVRRMAIFLRVSIYNGIQWAVFEPNDEPLWSSLRLSIGAFMLTQFRAGAFQGSSPADAFFVKCDKTTTTQQDIDNGVVNILVGFAPLKPAEFVVVKLSQKAGQSPS